MRRGAVAAFAAAILTTAAALGAAWALSSETRAYALEQAGIEADVPGAEGKPVALDPNGATRISAPVRLTGTRGSFDGDLRSLGGGKPRPKGERPEKGAPASTTGAQVTDVAAQGTAALTAAPAPSTSFAGLSYDQNGNGFPPDTNGDVGPDYYVQAVNTSFGIFTKTGTKVVAMPFDTLFQGTGTLCDTDNYGDPVVLYDTDAKRWILSDFAFTVDARGNLTSDDYQCFAVSKTSDPVNGGWWMYAFDVAQGGDMADYPKLGVWPSGIFMTANVFGPSTFTNVKAWAFNRSDLYSGATSPRAVSFSLPQTLNGGTTTVFSLLPSNARTQTGWPSATQPNLLASIWDETYPYIRVWKFTPDWTVGGTSTLTGPTDVPVAAFNLAPSRVASPANALDTLTPRLMMQNQYTSIGGVESLWLSHTVGTSSVARVRWYELPVTGGSVAAAPAQQSTWGSDAVNRFMPSLAVDKLGDMAVGYSVSSSTLNPGIRYAGRLAGDPAGTLTQSETTLAAGTKSQTYTNRWGDYAAMTLDPSDGCTFWFTSEVYDAGATYWDTRIGSFAYPACTGVTPPPTPTAPAAPSGLAATTASRTQINLTWTDNATDETGFKIERAKGTGAFAQIATVGANVTTYASTGLSRNTQYSYRVRATNGAGDSAYSNVATARTSK